MARLGQRKSNGVRQSVVYLTRPNDSFAALEFGHLIEEGNYYLAPFGVVVGFSNEEECRRALDQINQRSDQISCMHKRPHAYRLPDLNVRPLEQFPSLQHPRRARRHRGWTSEPLWHLR